MIGWALPITAIIFLVYGIFIARLEPMRLMDQLYMTTEGIFGIPIAVSASYVLIFVLFGSFMERTGTGQLFMDFAMALTGHTAGGPGKVSCVSSALFGTISGSAVANVMVDGPISIPLMKRSGFPPHYAAGVEAIASTGGQIMPPIMGAAAFVMAEFLGVSYAQVVIWAIIPVAALLRRLLRRGAFRGQAARTGRLAALGACRGCRIVMSERGHLFIPVVTILAIMYSGYSAPIGGACWNARLLSGGGAAALDARLCPTSANIIESFVDGAKNMLGVAMACACAGIVIGVVTLSGLGIVFTQFVVHLAKDTLLRRADPHDDRRHRARHGHADDAGLHHHDRAAGAGDHQARRDRARRAHVRLLLRDSLGDHATGRARGFRRGRPRQIGTLGDRLGRGQDRASGIHHSVHVRLRAGVADDRRLADDRLAHRSYRPSGSSLFAGGMLRLFSRPGHGLAARRRCSWRACC